MAVKLHMYLELRNRTFELHILKRWYDQKTGS